MLTPRKALGFWKYSRPFRERFGIWPGLRLANAVADVSYRHPHGTLVPVPVPGWRDPLWMRVGSSDVDVFCQVVLRSELEFDLEPPPRRIIDGGANIGIASRVFVNRWPAAQVVAIELDVGNYATLRKNCEMSPQVDARWAALWHERTTVHVRSSEYGEMGYRVDTSSAGTQQVAALPLEDLFDELSWDVVDLVKLDIEGAELEVLGAAPRWLHRVNHLVIELHEHFAPGCAAAFEAAIDRKVWSVRPHGEYLVASRLQPI